MHLARAGAFTRALTALLLAAPVVASAAEVCIWNYDSVDRFYDPEVGDSVDCAYSLALTLTAQGHAVAVFNDGLPADLSGYDITFCLMGWFRC
jgi:hypothetical protein